MEGPRLEQLQLIDVAHLRARFFPTAAEPTGVDYHALGGLGLERLVFHLLLAEGHSPRLFGRPGQEDYGVDLLVANGAKCRVFQCKNLVRFSLSKLRKALDDLADGWLTLPGVPRPKLFVVCCPVDLDDNKTAWEEEVKAFYQRYRVRVVTWCRGSRCFVTAVPPVPRLFRVRLDSPTA